MKKKAFSDNEVDYDMVLDGFEDDGEAAFWDEFMKLEEESEIGKVGEKITIEIKNGDVTEVYEDILTKPGLVRAD